MKPKRTGLRLLPAKRVAEKYLADFWRDWEKPEKRKRPLLPETNRGRKALKLSPTTLATVRRFENAAGAEAYVRNTRIIEKTIMGEKPEKFALQPVQFFSINGSLLLERVYRGPDVNVFLRWKKAKSRHSEALERNLKRRGVDLGDKQVLAGVKKAVSEAYLELLRVEAAKVPIASQECNVLFLDFDPKTRKVLFAIVDHEQPRSIQE